MWEIALLIIARGLPDKADREGMMGAALEMLNPPSFETPAHDVVAKAKSPRVIITHLPWQLLPKQLTEGKKGKVMSIISGYTKPNREMVHVQTLMLS